MPKRSRPRVKLPFALVPQGDGELAAQALEHAFLMLFPKVRNDFRVAVRDQAMAARLQLRPLLEVIEELAVEDHEDALGLHW